MLAEAKAQITYFIARTITEKLIPPVKLEKRDNATLESSRMYDLQQGNFKESANHYYSVYLTLKDPEGKAAALIGLSQELINLGSFQQVRLLLESRPPGFVNQLSEASNFLFQAQVKEKLGWIADYELGYFYSRRLFNEAGDLLNSIAPHKWGEEEKERYSTTRHFLGRAAYGLACLGIDKNKNTQEAINRFGEAMLYDKELQSSSELKIGFGHGWLARSYLLLKDFPRADFEIEEMKKSFQKQLVITPERGLMAHYHIVRGLRNLQKGLYVDAGGSFVEAIRIRTTVEPYPKGLADAYAGLAATFWRQGEPFSAIKYLAKAVQTHPHAVLRGAFGG